ASVLRTSRRPLASARSSSAASRFASAEPAASFAILLAGCAGALFAAGCPGIAVRRAVLAAIGEDINLTPFFDHFVFAQLALAVGRAFAGLHAVFVAVPGTHEMHFAVREVEPLRGLVRQQPLLDLGDGEALARGAALVQAEIAVGVELTLVSEY